jgi:hypothetical protein
MHRHVFASLMVRPKIAFAAGGVLEPLQYRIDALEQRVLLAENPAVERFNTSPALFVENQGQWADESVRFVHQGANATIALTDRGPKFHLYRPVEKTTTPLLTDRDLLQETPVMEGTQFSVDFDGANVVRPVGIDKSASVFNYFVGDKSNWRINVSGFEKIEYPNLYAGIDLQTWGKKTHLKYEFHVAPGVDYSQIQVSYEGIEELSIDRKGRLHVLTGLDEVIDDAPFVYQEIDGKQVEVKSKFVLVDKDTYGFKLRGKVDLSRELVIDPSLAWGSYLGGSGTDLARGIATKGSSEAWITGATSSSANFPTGGFDPTFNGEYDTFVAKVNSDGTLAWGTYLGGAGSDAGQAIAFDTVGNAWVTGYTYSTNFPNGGFDTTYNGGEDAFVAKINSNGTLAWGSYLGGSNGDRGKGIAADPYGNVWITGYTYSNNFPGGGFDSSYASSNDAFVAKVNANGTLAWGSFLGGIGGDNGSGISIDSSGNAWVAGYTAGTDFPGGGFDTTYNGGSDAFVAKVNANGSFAWGSYLGGSGNDWAESIAVDYLGNAWITGQTESSNFPAGGFDSSIAGSNDAFVAKINANGSFAWGSYLGGSSDDHGWGVALDGTGNARITGLTTSTDFPGGGFDTTFNGDGDVFVAKVTMNGSLAWGSYLGGSSYDESRSIAVDAMGNTWVVGDTHSSNFPSGGFDASHNGGTWDGFIARISNLPSSPSTPTVDATYDSGVLGDGITNSKRPRILGMAEPLLTVRLYDGANLLGGSIADTTGLYSFLPIVDLAEGSHSVTAVAVDDSGNSSAPSSTLSLTIDTKLTVAASFAVDANKQQLSYSFAERMSGLPVITDFVLQNLTTATSISTSVMTLNTNLSNGAAIFTFTGLDNGCLSDGNYLAILSTLGVADVAGNHVAGPVLTQFFFLNGDANRDRRVTTLDFNMLTANFGGSQKHFSQGDFNYDASVTSVDFGILLAQYGKSLPAPGPLPSAVSMALGMPGTSVFADKPVVAVKDRAGAFLTSSDEIC